MKKIVTVFVVINLMFVLLCGCNATNNTSSDVNNQSSVQNSFDSDELYRDHQELTTTIASFDNNNSMRISIPEVGLENVFIQEKFNLERVSAEEYGNVYLLADDRYGGGCFPYDLYLAIECSDKLVIKDLSKWENNACYDVKMELCDVDGNPDVEIVINVCVSMTGGMGNYLSRVFDFKDGEIIEMFSSIDDTERDFDTGYSITILKNRNFKIENKFTGYSEIFNDCREIDELSVYYWYHPETGDIKDITLWVDPFYQFSSIDIDEDGVYEILCRQYVCLVDHADSLGTAKTILKYDRDIGDFKIVSAEFEYDEYY